ncbi:MAG: CBS domain-containing protein [Gammaproteobacteria bacterium]|nr:CBS domain-containing protein [Gammaproteobacteria bacterium]
MKVQEIMTKKVEYVTPNATLRQAARKMGQLGVGFLPVIENGILIGIITDRDIACHAIGIGRDANWTDVQKVMKKEVITCFDDDDISDAAHLMEDHHIHRLPVLHHDNSLAGILSVDDLARGSHDLAGEVLERTAATH